MSLFRRCLFRFFLQLCLFFQADYSNIYIYQHYYILCFFFFVFVFLLFCWLLYTVAYNPDFPSPLVTVAKLEDHVYSIIYQQLEVESSSGLSPWLKFEAKRKETRPGFKQGSSIPFPSWLKLHWVIWLRLANPFWIFKFQRILHI